MCNKRIQNARTVEEEIRWLDDLGLDAEEKISILQLMMSTSSLEDQEVMKETIDAIIVEKYLLGVEDK
jgi:hypothetical protein